MVYSARDSKGGYRLYRSARGLSDTPVNKGDSALSPEQALPKLPVDATYVGSSETAQGTVVQMPEATDLATVAIFGAGLIGLWLLLKE